MAKFVELNDAAKMLGITPDQLVEMRSNNEIHGYRDGASWKFKIEEVERVVAERSGGGAQDEFSFGADDAADESILVSEEELGHSGESTSSTIIGKGGEAEPAESDLTLSADADSGLELSDSSLSASADSGSELGLDDGSDLKLQGLDNELGVDSDVSLVPGAGLDSDVSLVPDPGSDKDVESASSDELTGSDLELQSASSGGTGNLGSASDSGDLAADSELALSDDDDLVLSGSDSGSDLSLGAADSGINLSSPSDSGLSLEADSGISLQSPTDSGLSLEDEPLEMGGGSSISSLELPEDEEVLALDESADEESLQQDEQFMLTPSEAMPAQDESDSGSQVIALEDSEAFDQDAMAVPGGDALLAESDGLEAQLDALGGGAPAAAMGPAAGYAAAELPEAPYSVWNIMGLVLILIFLSLTGVMMTDVLRNMWGWEEGRDVSTSISRGISSAFGD